MHFVSEHIIDTLRYWLSRVVAVVAVLAAFSIVGACRSDHDPDIGETEDETVLLALDITPLENASAKEVSRANVVDSDNFFELPERECEKLNSLRVIIVAKNTGIVEANRLIAVGADGRPVADNLIFRTKPGEKVVYLFGNEESLSQNIRNLFESMRVGSGASDLDEITLTRPALDKPLFDFGSDDYNGYYRVPMSERWEISVEKAEIGGKYQQADLFITRAVTKFSFRLRLAEDFNAIPADTITDIVVNGIGCSEYLIPKNTVYSPEKGVPSSNPYQGRWITQYSTPATGNPVGPATFTPDNPLILRNLVIGNSYTFAPYVYMPESSAPEGGFTCQLRYGKTGLTDPVKLPNLESLPRNTHVVVDITVGNDFQMMLDVKVLPWNSEIYEYDYSTNIGIPDDGYLTFDAGTYRNLDKTTARLLLDYPKPVRARFGISTPIGATWDAYLITTAGEEDAIRFRTVDSSGTYTYSTHISGSVGNMRNIIDITSVMAPGSNTRSARLQITVTLPGGVTVPVNILNSKEYGANEYITIVQNPQ